MITRLSHSSVFVLDQDSAKSFYTEKLGFELRFDVSMGEAFEGAGAGFRWLTVGPKGQPDVQIILSDCSMGHDPQTAEELALVPQVPGSLDAALDALESDQKFLQVGGVFTPDLLETWVEYKRTTEIDEIRLRPHPWEFMLYYDI